ncbi:aldo/keto reductase [Rhizobium sp. BR 314]|uniref:aldo/keto reductase n=1 Tax=Rhizobium sp. BR 314 TaxID=3040013 RepID=UPI0039BFF8CE
MCGRYSPENPPPKGIGRAEVYNGILSQLKVLTERLAVIGQAQGAVAADVATAWAIAKGTTPIIGFTKPSYIDDLVGASTMTLTGDDIAELEALADAANVSTRRWREKDMQLQNSAIQDLGPQLGAH